MYVETLCEVRRVNEDPDACSCRVSGRARHENHSARDSGSREVTPRRLGSFTVAIMGAWLSAAPLAQTPAVPAPATVPAQEIDGDQGVGSQGDPDPGVHFIVVVDNPQVRVLQFTLQPGASRRPHVHNDVTFSMM